MSQERSQPQVRAADTPQGASGLLASMRIRKKLLVLHTCFSLVLATILALALRPQIGEVIRQAESHEASLVLTMIMNGRRAGSFGTHAGETLGTTNQNVHVRTGDAASLGIDQTSAVAAKTAAEPIALPGVGGGWGGWGSWLGAGAAPVMATYDASRDEYVTASVVLQGARDAVLRLYGLFTIALLAVYALVAVALELFVLPKAVYQPIQTMLDADAALQSGNRQGEIIPAALIPADELGSIMTSRNDSVLSMRRHEADLADALRRLEAVAADLTRKNHLLEMARQNLADADRLASLGMMSAGIAHELNTPLAVIKGLAERLNSAENQASDGRAAISREQASLMLRVVGRLERLSESLLDFARVRSPASSNTLVRPLVDDAWTLVQLDREARQVDFTNRVPADLEAFCDGDRIVQVLVNILRNAVDAATGPASIRDRGIELEVNAEGYERDGVRWTLITITDNGPGIKPELLGRLFQPFVSSRLDAKGTGLGLAVAEGIVREHGGLILARNRLEGSGAVFEIVLPRQAGVAHLPADQLSPRAVGDDALHSPGPVTAYSAPTTSGGTASST